MVTNTFATTTTTTTATTTTTTTTAVTTAAAAAAASIGDITVASAILTTVTIDWWSSLSSVDLRDAIEPR